jgi:hypothetical protein
MNSELYTKEFRSYKYLKSSPASVEFFKKQYHIVNLVQPWTKERDPNFVWPHRVEFLEQLIDLEKEQVYIVNVDSIFSSPSRFSEAKIAEVKEPVIYCGHMLKPSLGRILTITDIHELEPFDQLNKDVEKQYYLCSSDYFSIKDTVCLSGNCEHTGFIFRLVDLPIISIISPEITLSAMFYDEETAKKYAKDVADHLRNYAAALSAIVAKL